MPVIHPNSVNIDKWLKLIRAEGVGPVIFSKLYKRFNNIDTLLGASVNELSKVEGIGYKTAEKIASTREKFDTESELELAEKLGVWIVNINDNRYPPSLKQIYDPPPVLYIKGTITKQDNLAISIVGSRRCSNYGLEQASRFAHLLASSGFTICSGMARGIDTAAHHGALSAEGRTIAVFGNGLANIFPPENKKLSELISHSGACISELPLNYEPLAANFPARNRIIAAMSLGTIVVEAALRSGALLTASAAIEYNKEVMAVPGRIDSPASKGSNKLIKEGACLIQSIDDILEALGQYGEQLKEHTVIASERAEEIIESPLFNTAKINLSKNEQKVYDSLNKETKHIDDIIVTNDISAGNINAALISLQLKGLIKQLPGNLYKKK